MLVRLAIVLAAVGVAALALRRWRRAPLLSRIDPATLGFTGPAIVQFSAPYCAPCERARPHLERAARESGVAFVDVDLAVRPDLAGRYGIRSVPVVIVAGPDGQVLGRWTGTPPGGEIRSLAERARAV